MKVQFRVVLTALAVSVVLGAAPLAPQARAGTTWDHSCQYVHLDYWNRVKEHSGSGFILQLGGYGCWNPTQSWFAYSTYSPPGFSNPTPAWVKLGSTTDTLAYHFSYVPPRQHWNGTYGYLQEVTWMEFDVSDDPYAAEPVSFNGHEELRLYESSNPDGARWSQYNYCYSNSAGSTCNYWVQNWYYGKIDKFYR